MTPLTTFLLFCLFGFAVVACFSSVNSPVSFVQKQQQQQKQEQQQRGAFALKSSYHGEGASTAVLPPLSGKAQRVLPPRRNGFFNRLSFEWATEIMRVGNKKPLELSDLWKLDEAQLMSNVTDTFDAYFSEEQRRVLEACNTTSVFLAQQEVLKNKTQILMQFWASPVTKAVVKMYSKPLLHSGVLKLFNTLVQFLPSILVARILGAVDRTTGLPFSARFNKESMSLACGLFSVLCAKTFLENQYFYTVIDMSASIRGALSAAVYRKALKLGPGGRQNATSGEILNYMQLDTSRMEGVASTIHVVWDGLLQVVGYTGLLLYYLGPSVFAGIAAMLIILPLNAVFLKKLSRLRAENLKQTDKRVKLTNEILQGVRAIKSYNWEKPFVDQLSEIRAKEINTLKASANTRAILVSMLSAAPSVVAVLTLAVYALLGNKLTSTKVFTALGLFNQLRFPLIFLPMLINTLAEGKVSLNRLTKFLLADEIQNYVEEVMPVEEDVSTAILIQNGNFSWSSSASNTSTHPSSTRGSLTNVNIRVKKGELVALVGPVGSGKSTCISALLGDLNKEHGRVAISGRVAYVPQAAWIPQETLRNVILFGREMDEPRYKAVIKSSGLTRDLELLESGDETEIGERGANLSGGQKQRLSIARAVYDDADVYLMDDPLSALDTEVGARVFHDCILGTISGKTRILATHQLNLLPEVDRIILLSTNPEDNSCSVLDQGTFSELLLRGHDLSKLVKDKQNEQPQPEVASPPVIVVEAVDLQGEKQQLNEAPTTSSSTIVSSVEEAAAMCVESAITKHATTAAVATDASSTSAVDNLHMQQAKGHVSPEAAIRPTLAAVPNHHDATKSAIPVLESTTSSKSPPQPPTTTKAAKLMTLEERAEGVVGLHVYQDYLKAANKPLLMAMVVISFVLANVSQQLQQWIVAAWTSDSSYVTRPLPVYLSGVAVMAIGVAFFNWSRTYVGCLLGAAASKTMHRNMAKRVLNAPLSYFESTPVGRLVQRFTKDLDQIDQQLPGSFGQLVASSLNIAAAIIAIVLVTPSFAALLIPVFGVYMTITNYYRNVARELKRLDSISRSPVFAHFGETLGGLPVIRSFLRQGMFRRSNEVKLEDNMSAYYALKVVDRWLSVRLELLGNTIVFFSALLALLSGSRSGSAGLSLNNALGVTGLLNWAVRNGVETESLMNSVERVLYTSTQTPQEASPKLDFLDKSTFTNNQPSDIWASLPVIAATGDTANGGEGAGIIPTSPVMEHAQVRLPASDDELLTGGWPWGGGIVFKNVQMRYRDDFQPVLRGVDLEINPGEFLGIVGRTGSGKSSIFRALLRLTELEQGSISIDGVDVSRIGLDALRSNIAIIPQDPVMFSGSIRLNIDPFNTQTDKMLWEALRRSNLEATVRALPGGLSFQVTEGGENFSLGQRQLICLARALVRRSRILLMDEATSSVDYETDAIIQRTIRDEFGGGKCTVLTIAHRLASVLDADRILVMDQGSVGELASPKELLRSKDSLLSSLVAAETKQDNRRSLADVAP